MEFRELPQRVQDYYNARPHLALHRLSQRSGKETWFITVTYRPSRNSGLRKDKWEFGPGHTGIWKLVKTV